MNIQQQDTTDKTDKVINKQDIIDIEILSYPDKLIYFRSLPHYKQKSKEWLDQRNNHITASIVSVALGYCSKYEYNKLMLNKISYGKKHSFKGNVATHHGCKYEILATNYYGYINKCDVYEFGLLKNPKYPILGISPDGISSHNRMLEIKFPFSRKIDGHIKIEYYHQIQAQLAVCTYDICDFIECKLVEVDQTIFKNTSNYKGIVVGYLDINISTENIIYEYSPVEIWNDYNKLRKWHNKTKTFMRNTNNLIYIQSTFWVFETYLCRSVKRDPNWIINEYPKLIKLWDKITYYRENGYVDDFDLCSNSSTEYDLITNGECII